MSHAPIGVFDSGLGGLTAVRQLARLVPGEDIIYFGDTGRVPYGTRGHAVIIAYARQDIGFMLSQKVKTILAACGTVSSTFPASEAGRLPVPYRGVVEAAVDAALAATHTGRIAVLGTPATIASGSYAAALRARRSGLTLCEQACPLFVPLVENGHYRDDDPLVRLVAQEYLAPVKEAGVDTAILGCTHFPLLREALAAELGPAVTLIDSGAVAAQALRDDLIVQGLQNPRSEGGSISLFVSDAPDRFDTMARLFLGTEDLPPVQLVNIEKYEWQP